MEIFEAESFKIFLMVMARFGGLMVAAPVLGSGNYPMLLKAGFTGLTALLLTPLIPAMEDPLPDSAVALSLIAASELAIGLAIGFVMTIVFAAIQVGGQIMDMQTGFGMMNVFNPAMESQVPIFGFFLFIIAVLFLLVLQGHHMMIEALVSTYQEIPIGGFVLRPEQLLEVGHWGRSMFIDGVMIAAPVATAMMLAYITMGLLGRVVPQIHLFVIGFPITIATGLLVTSAIIGIYLTILDGMFYRMFDDVETLIRGMG